MNKHTKNYAMVFLVFALLAVSLAAADLLNKILFSYQNLYLFTDESILKIFAIDYFYGLYKANDKMLYF